MSVPAAITLGIGIGVLAMSPLLGIGAVYVAEQIQRWNMRVGR